MHIQSIRAQILLLSLYVCCFRCRLIFGDNKVQFNYNHCLRCRDHLFSIIALCASIEGTSP
ncbi:hypothetical protein HanXRQr2_Chr01g0010461 [Helianthus annuus]|uniref:Uncharacterized protein n=1 Tax=Helianthus annuus TaxID=4232 RepID=A0A251VN21_HELAN|nr:hypothetical protein HanXRQr2_Chr01g0010461 [Helianthus annuus]